MLLTGCREEEGITHYKVPPLAQPRDEVPEPDAKVRLLAAIIPQGEQAWFFKLVGPVAAVGEQEQAFDAFIRSVRFTGDAKKPVAWQVPAGWREEPGKMMRYATFRMGPAETPLELSVLVASGSLIDNVNRWRKLDLGLADLPRGQLGKVVREVKTEAGTVQRVDMNGPGGKGGMKPPFAP
jgi:hypothetical protein